MLVSLHDLMLAARHADRVVVIDRGRIVADGTQTSALNRDRLSQTFGISGSWIDTPSGPLLDLSRRQG